mgnify:CR=1 FL=1
MKNKLDTSRRKTPWDNEEELNSLQNFIKNKYLSNYNYKHPKLSQTSEYEIFNSIKIENCRYCNSVNIKKNGKNCNNVQVYFCNDCKKKFNPTTCTIFENHKISISEWIEYLLGLFNYSSSSLSSKTNKNSINTSRYWLQKIFLVLKNYQKDIILREKVYIDEMYYKVIKSDVKTKNGKQLRGLSSNQYCIGIGFDEKNVIAIVEGKGKTSSDKTKKVFLEHIEINSKIIHDDEKAHEELIKDLNLQDESYNSLWLKNIPDNENPLRPINHQCDLIRKFLNTHSGFDREYLQDYLNLYCFISNISEVNKLQKVYDFIELALHTNISLKYRDLFGSNKKDAKN